MLFVAFLNKERLFLKLEPAAEANASYQPNLDVVPKRQVHPAGQITD